MIVAAIIKHPFRDFDWRVDILDVSEGTDLELLKQRLQSEMLGPFEVLALTARINFNRTITD